MVSHQSLSYFVIPSGVHHTQLAETSSLHNDWQKEGIEHQILEPLGSCPKQQVHQQIIVDHIMAVHVGSSLFLLNVIRIGILVVKLLLKEVLHKCLDGLVQKLDFFDCDRTFGQSDGSHLNV